MTLPDPAVLGRAVMLVAFDEAEFEASVSTLTPPHLAARVPHIVFRRTGGRVYRWPLMDRATCLLSAWADGYAASLALAAAARTALLASRGYAGEGGRIHRVREITGPVEVPGVAPDGLIRHDAVYELLVRPARD